MNNHQAAEPKRTQKKSVQVCVWLVLAEREGSKRAKRDPPKTRKKKKKKTHVVLLDETLNIFIKISLTNIHEDVSRWKSASLK